MLTGFYRRENGRLYSAVIPSTTDLPSAPPQTIRTSEISRMEECHALVTFDWHPRLVRGVKLVLKDSDSLAPPLGFPDTKEMLRRLELAVSVAR